MKRVSLFLLLVLFSAVAMAQQTKKKTKSKSSVAAAKKPAATPAASTSATNALLYQKWVNSFEDEKGDGVEVYRPDGYSFPASRGRKAISFQKTGTVVRFDIGPNDAQKILMGNWERTKYGNTMKVTVQGAESGVYFVEVVSVSKDMLKIRRKLEI